METKKLELADEIISAVLSASAFERFMAECEDVNEADRRIDEVLESIADVVPVQALEDLRDTVAQVTAAYSKAGTLYGIHVAATMSEAAAHPADLSRYIMERVKKVRDEE